MKSVPIESLFYKYSLNFNDRDLESIILSPSNSFGPLTKSNFSRTPKIGDVFSGIACSKDSLYFYYTAIITAVSGTESGTAGFRLMSAQRILNVSSANNATNDQSGRNISNTYAKISDLTSLTSTTSIKVARAAFADSTTMINGLEIKNSNGILKIGDIIIPQKRLILDTPVEVRWALKTICNNIVADSILEIYTSKGIFKIKSPDYAEYCCGRLGPDPVQYITFSFLNDTTLQASYNSYTADGGLDLNDSATIYKVYSVIE